MSNVTPLKKLATQSSDSARIEGGMNLSPYLSPLDVTEYVPGVTTRQLQEWRSNGRGPQYAHAGKTVIYRRADIDKWVDSNLVGTRDQS